MFIKDKKGFTLIELLAVIVILAILVMVAIPAVTKYLNAARQGTFVDNAKSAISAVRNEVIINGYTKSTYTLSDINDLLERKLNNSPFNSAYTTGSYIQVTQTENPANSGEYVYTYSMCLADDGGHGFTLTAENELDESDIEMTGVTCSST